MRKKPESQISVKSKPKKSAKADVDFDRIIARVERIEAQLREEQPTFDPLELLPDVDVVLRVARREYETLNAQPTRAHQQVTRNLVKSMAARINPEEGGTLAVKMVNDAIDATESLALRAGFFVGLARGLAWIYAGEASTAKVKAPKTQKQGGAR